MAARGLFQFPSTPNTNLGAGLSTEFGVLLPPGGKVVAYVRSSGAQQGDDPQVAKRIVPTLNAALAYCSPGHGDIVVVLPGHAENVSSADQMSALVAGAQIIGVGRGSVMPKLTWTAATASFLLDQPNVRLKGLRLNLSPDSGTVTVAAPITISAAGCAIEDCEIRTSVDANSLSTIPITTTAAADDLDIIGNRILGATAGACTTGIQLVGADRLRFMDNFVSVATSGVAVGAVRFLTTDSLDIQMLGNRLQNRLAASTHALTGTAGTTGLIDHLLMMVNSGVAGANTTGGLWFGRQCYVSDGGGTRAALFGTEST